ncbi:MAG: O-antigen ligase family protein [Polyangiaceae bacterium]|nr:O-antigen ligase family protein [Polyangiaceae bacterium]
MKWGVIVLTTCAFLLVGHFATRRPWLRKYLATCLGLLPFFDITLNPLSYELIRLDTRGIEFALVDFFALASVVALRKRRSRSIPFKARFWFYFFVCAVSAVVAIAPLFSLFSTWKVLRTFLLFWAVYRVCAVDAQLPQVTRGLAFAVVVAAGMALYQRYIGGENAVSGPFGHQNSLAVAANLVAPFCAALALTGKGGRLAAVTVLSAAVCIILSLSRGGMASFAVAMSVVYVASLAKKVTPKKLATIGLSIGGACLVLVRSLDTIVERFVTAPKSSAEARHLFEEAAQAMVHDAPWGVGINQFSMVLDKKYADVLGMAEIDRSGIVHNMYWLTLAELGYLGLFAFCLLYFSPLLAAARGAWRERHTVYGDLLVGLATAFALVLAQSTLEWTLRMTQVGNVFWVLAGMTVAVTNRRSQ